MNWRQLGRLVQLARATPARLRRPITREEAEARLRRQIAGRSAMFLEAARRLIYARAESPYRRLLLHAGCRFEDLERSVAAHGVEGALERLRDLGVRLKLEEFKLRTPIRRPGLTFQPAESDFDGAAHPGDGIEGTTSGSRSAATKVLYDWEFIAEEAAHELLLYHDHGVLDHPLALWYPMLPGVAGVHNLLMNLRTGRPPDRWFSQLDPRNATPLHALALAGIRWGGRLAGLRVPAPEFAGLDRADRVLDWMAAARRNGRSAVVRTYVSSAVRLAERARARGDDVSGAVIFAGGEPLTETRRRFIESAGWNVFPRYVATEPGLIAAACSRRGAGDDMHVYTDRVAVIPGADDGAGASRAAASPGGDAAGGRATPLLFTTLSLHTGKVLLNTELGDAGRLTTRSCGCVFGRMGFDLHLSDVGSQERLTIEGMTVPVSALDALIGAIVEEAGGSPDSYQYRPASDDSGIERLVVAVSPEAGPLDEAAFLDTLYSRLERGGPGLDVAGPLWRQAGSIRLVREAPRLSGGAKLRPVTGNHQERNSGGAR